MDLAAGFDVVAAFAGTVDGLVTSITCALPLLVCVYLWRARGADVWARAEVYAKPDEYGERKRWDSSIRQPWNAWSSLSYYFAGVYVCRDIILRARSRAEPLNCVDASPQWQVAFGVGLLWTGIASFLFHASLTERWRKLDAGATMAVTVVPMVHSIYRALCSAFAQPAPSSYGSGAGNLELVFRPQPAGMPPLLEPLAFGMCVLGMVGCHVLAATPGWSDIVLVTNLVGHLLVEHTLLASTKTPQMNSSYVLYAALMLSGVALRAADVVVAKGVGVARPQRSVFTRVAWLGHFAWHVLTSLGIGVLVSSSSSEDFVEPYCQPRHDAPTSQGFDVLGALFGGLRTTLSGADTPQAAATAAATAELEATYRRGDWRFLPNYPLGHVQILDHEPWRREHVAIVAATTVLLILVRRLLAVLVPPLAVRVATALHGKDWHSGEHATHVDWRRFADNIHATILHVVTTAYAIVYLRAEVAGWRDDPSEWWAFVQPPLSAALKAFYLVELGITCEASLSMIHSVATGRAKDLPMVAHHVATLVVILAAFRFHFVRVGAAVLVLHDASDLPIDGIRISQALQIPWLLYVSAALSVASWAALRAWCFPRYIIHSAITRTAHIWPTYHFVPDAYILCGYAIYIIPLVLLWCLSCFWLAQIARKLATAAGGGKKQAAARSTKDGSSTSKNGSKGRSGGRRQWRWIAAAIAAVAAVLARDAGMGASGDPLPAHRFAVEAQPNLRTTACHYHTWDTVWSAPLMEHLHPTLPEDCDPYVASGCEAMTFDGAVWSRWTSHNWQYPLLAVPTYLVSIRLLQRYMASRPAIRLPYTVAAWNFFLSTFSFAGAAHCVPRLLFGHDGLLTAGFYASVCTHASSYGCGAVGLFVALFIYSKFAELLDTLFLLLRRNPLILLHWYHHASVLLYCWHSYASRIGTGLWYASMNYTVHALMYFYFGLTQCGPRARQLAKRCSVFVTLLQLLQMVGGITVTVASAIYHHQGRTCYVSLANSILGLLMYLSYFVLFAKLFYDHYLSQKGTPAAAGTSDAATSKGGSATGAAKADAYEKELFVGWAGKGGEPSEVAVAAYAAAEMVAQGRVVPLSSS